jgi:hypothetical protein
VKKYLKLSGQMNVLTYSRAISHVIAELKTSVSEISYISIIRIDVVNGHMLLIFSIRWVTTNFDSLLMLYSTPMGRGIDLTN